MRNILFVCCKDVLYHVRSGRTNVDLSDRAFAPQFYAQLTDIRVDQHAIKESMKAMAAQMTTQNAATPAPTSSHTANAQASAGADANSNSSSSANSTLVPAGSPPTSRSPTNPSPGTVSGSLQVSTELYMARTCGKKLCTCRCHSVRRLETAPWASSLVGSLFIGYSGLPLPFTPKIECNQSDCQRNPRSLIKVAWYFPSWWPLAGNVLHFIDQWTPLDGHDITIKLPRVVPPSADIFILAQKGHVDGIRQLIRQGKASVFDISASEGRSALHVSLYCTCVRLL